MAFPVPLIKLSFGGGVASDDIWTNSFHIADFDNDPTDLFNALSPQQFVAAATAFYLAGGQMSINPFNTLSWIKLALIGRDGKYVPGYESKIYDFPTPQQGGSPLALSPQDSIVVTLQTERKRGLASKGRFYPPSGFMIPSSTTGRLAATTINTFGGKAVALINSINTIASNGQPNSAGLVVASNVGSGAYNPITGVSVGNLMDNQRRRRNRLKEVYTDFPLVP